MKTRYSVTIGIPAHNEEHNIARLIRALLQQKGNEWVLDKIVVYSDGCTDNTVKIIETLKSKSIKIIESRDQRGRSYAQQHIINSTNTDYLILLDGDVIPTSENFFNELLKPLTKDDSVGLTSAQVVSLEGDSLFSRIIVWSHKIKSKLYASLAPSSVYLCHGRARAFSHDFYAQLSFPNVIAEDAYSYFRCLELGYTFAYCPKAKVLFKSPSNLSDHLLQSRRFFRGTKEIHTYFPDSTLTRSYKIPPRLMLRTWATASLERPFYTLMYILILVYSFLTNIFRRTNTSAIWTPSISSKRL